MELVRKVDPIRSKTAARTNRIKKYIYRYMKHDIWNMKHLLIGNNLVRDFFFQNSTETLKLIFTSS